MNGRDEELLSAYYDGELPDEEKSRAEQLLADDLAARELLDDVADVGSWIRTLPRPSAPADTHRAVMARLQCAAAPQPSSTHAPANPNRRRRAVWATISTAGLLLAVVSQRYWPAPQAGGRGGAMVAMADRDAGSETVSLTAQSDVAAGTTVTALGQAAPATPDTRQLAISNSSHIQQRLAAALERGDAPVAGEERTDLTEIGDRVVVIRYRVVDKLQLPGQVQLVLTEKGINDINANGVAPTIAAEQFGANADRQLAAFYVEAPESSFQSAVATITTLDGVTDVTTNFVAVEAGTSSEGLTVQESAWADSADRRLAKDETPAPAIIAPSGGETSDFSPAPLSAARSDSTLEFEPADNSAATDQPSLEGRNVAESAPARGQHAAAPLAYQVPVPAEQQLVDELQSQEAEVAENANGLQPETKLAASAAPPSSGPTHRWNYFFSKRDGAASPATDRVRAVLLLVPEPAE